MKPIPLRSYEYVKAEMKFDRVRKAQCGVTQDPVVIQSVGKAFLAEHARQRRKQAPCSRMLLDTGISYLEARTVIRKRRVEEAAHDVHD